MLKFFKDRGKPKCPYCNEVLDKKPKRKKKCPNCGNFIYIRQGKMVTELETEKLNWLSRLEGYGLDSREYDKREKALQKKFKTQPIVNDVIWSWLNWKVSKNQDTNIMYLEMARIAVMEGKDSKPYIQEVNKHKLLELKSIGIIEVKVVGYGNSNDDDLTCDECKKLFGKRLNLSDELKNPQIPSVCSELKCRCSYVPYHDDWFERLLE